MTDSSLRRCVSGLAILCAAGWLAGCGGNSGDSADKSASDPKSAGGNTPPKSQPVQAQPKQPAARHVAANNTGRKRGVYTDAKGQKWWNNHPYDIWYRDAYKVAGNAAKVGGGNPVNGGGNKVAKKDPPKTGMKKKDPPPNAGGTDWQAIADIADIETEVKLLRNYLQQKMKTPASYRQEYRQIEQVGWALATLGQVLSQHPGQSNLKRNALYIRDLGQAIAEKATGRAPKDFRATKVPYEQLIDTLNGSPPAGLKEPKKDAVFSDFTERGGLMNRMDRIHKWMDKEVNTADKMKSEAERVKREASVLAVFYKTIGDKSFDSAEDPDYRGHVLESIKQTQNIKAALKTGDFPAYQKAVSTIFNRCNQCHTKYKQ